MIKAVPSQHLSMSANFDFFYNNLADITLVKVTSTHVVLKEFKIDSTISIFWCQKLLT